MYLVDDVVPDANPDSNVVPIAAAIEVEVTDDDTDCATDGGISKIGVVTTNDNGCTWIVFVGGYSVEVDWNTLYTCSF